MCRTSCLTFSAGRSRVGGLANALKPIFLVDTLSAITTRFQQALIDTRFTLHSCKTSFTGASIPVVAIYTCSIVLTRIASAFIGASLALHSFVPRSTWTLISLGQNLTRGIIMTRGWNAVVNFHFAKFSAITRRTLTNEVWRLHNTLGAILTNVWTTNLRRNVTLQTAESWGADAFVAVYLPFNVWSKFKPRWNSARIESYWVINKHLTSLSIQNIINLYKQSV